MENIDNKLASFLNKKNTKPAPGQDLQVPQRDGLFERRELINPKLVTKDGRQLLREDTYQA